VREWLVPEHKEDLGPFTYHWLKAQLAAVSSDYDDAAAHLLEMSRQVSTVPMPGRKDVSLSWAAGVLLGQTVLEAAPMGPGSSPDLELFRGSMGLVAAGVRRQLPVNLLRGLLALEAGRTNEARDRFREIVSVARAAGPALTEAGGPLVEADVASYWLGQMARAQAARP
jgi:hypothetical protein